MFFVKHLEFIILFCLGLGLVDKKWQNMAGNIFIGRLCDQYAPGRPMGPPRLATEPEPACTELFVGLDLHKNTSTLCIKTQEGKEMLSRKIPTDKDAMTQLIIALKDKCADISLAMEPVSQWYFYADLLQSPDIDVRLAHPMRVKAIASARVKTDKIDAAVLADLLRANLLPEAYFSPIHVRAWKERCRFRASLVHLRTQTKNKIHAILFKNSLKHNFADLFGKSGRNWLVTLALKEPFRGNLDKYLVLLDQLNALIKASEQDIENTVKDYKQASLLVAIPGISYCSALTIIAEIGEIKRFKSAKHLQSYAGLVPSAYSSGDKLVHGRITKQGSKWLRWIMIEAAHQQPRCKKVRGLGSYYNAKKKIKGSKTATVATARKLLAVVRRLLKDERPYEENPPQSRKSGWIAPECSPILSLANQREG